MTLEKELTCPSCGVVVAHAGHRRFPPRLVLTSPEGPPVVSESVGLLMTLARQRRDDDALAFLRRYPDERVFELHCRNGHRTLRTMPQIVRAMRHSPGAWVDLRMAR